jgi:hypothetical protein
MLKLMKNTENTNEMYELIKFALETKFEAPQVNSIMEIIWKTPNPIVAAHKLLGIYVTPVINEECHPDVSKQELDKKFIAYDEWKDEIEYEYTAFVDKDDEKDHHGNPVKHAKTYYRNTSRKRWNTGSW